MVVFVKNRIPVVKLKFRVLFDEIHSLPLSSLSLSLSLSLSFSLSFSLGYFDKTAITDGTLLSIPRAFRQIFSLITSGHSEHLSMFMLLARADAKITRILQATSYIIFAHEIYFIVIKSILF